MSLCSSNDLSKSASHYFYCFNVFKSVSNVSNGHGTQSRLYVLLLQSQHQPCWMSHHDIKHIKLYNPLIVTSTQGTLNTTEQLLFYYFRFNIFKKGKFRGLFKKEHIVRKFCVCVCVCVCVCLWAEAPFSLYTHF